MKPMMNDEKLLECPFCGSLEVYLFDELVLSHVFCSSCGSRTDDDLDASMAVKSWNTRNGHLYTADDYKQDALEREHGL
ncbi:Lar-like restriction alleviation protein [Klebsiella phage VLCpiS13b]|uniref:Lar-like restriction alleviation protein n=1 Tax=Klebsiella phage VLCpiS13b TaxID=2874886 RepID=UPI00233F564A|nr:Lar-like restriction alleviation protein [Klebsiella phage VLCpiS13b]UVX30600.1 Lar-like restriction alleviation protein [Klebsiella phage VLCpiS13b]